MSCLPQRRAKWTRTKTQGIEVGVVGCNANRLKHSFKSAGRFFFHPQSLQFGFWKGQLLSNPSHAKPRSVSLKFRAIILIWKISVKKYGQKWPETDPPVSTVRRKPKMNRLVGNRPPETNPPVSLKSWIGTDPPVSLLFCYFIDVKKLKWKRCLKQTALFQRVVLNMEQNKVGCFTSPPPLLLSNGFNQVVNLLVDFTYLCAQGLELRAQGLELHPEILLGEFDFLVGGLLGVLYQQ